MKILFLLTYFLIIAIPILGISGMFLVLNYRRGEFGWKIGVFSLLTSVLILVTILG